MNLRESPELREDIKTKNTLQFGHCPNYPNPPPHPPIRATLPTLSGRQKRRFARMAEKNTDDDLITGAGESPAEHQPGGPEVDAEG